MKIVRLPVLTGLLVASVVSTGSAALLHEKFVTNPVLDGWSAYGNTNLFAWDATNQVINVTWDSTQPNSFFYHPLDRTYSIADGFLVQFDLQLSDAVTPDGFQSELGVGLFQFSAATNTDYLRTYATTPNVCEFDYFPVDDQGDAASIDATLLDASANLYFAFDAQPLNPGVTYHVLLIHQPGASVISEKVFTNGLVFSSVTNAYSSGPIGDFQLDTLSISSYQSGGFGDILAHGTVGNLAFASPLPVGWLQTPAAGQVEFRSDTHWLYTLEESADFQTWTPAAAAVFGNGANLRLQATNPPADRAGYRVEAQLP